MNTNAAIGMHLVAAIFFVRNEHAAIAQGDDLVETGRSPASTRVRCGYWNALLATHKGEALITVMPEYIQSASMTAEWEQKLLEIECGAYDSERFIDEIETLVRHLIDTYEIIPNAEVLMRPAKEPAGNCPYCGGNVVEKAKGFFCENKDCKFALWKGNRFFEALSQKMTRSIAEQLLKNGRAKLKMCKSVKTGKHFGAVVVMTVDEGG